jgi:hypothetical protein
MSCKLLIIGAGQLGSRHLQGLAQIDQPLDIYLVDPAELSLTVASARFEDVRKRTDHQIFLLPDMSCVPKLIDVAIIATASDIRFEAIEKLLEKCTVRNLVLEKVLFQNLTHYSLAESILGELASKTWVNCSQRLWPFFIDLKKQFFDDPNLEIVVSGSNWGLGCNAVHNTDISEYLWSSQKLHEADLDEHILASKRQGFSEFTGTFITKVIGGGGIKQISYAQGSAPFVFDVFHPDMRIHWNVSEGRIYTANRESDWRYVAKDMSAPFQSQLTATVVTSILNGSDCGLPKYSTASVTHLATLSSLIFAARKNGIEFGSICPVT